MEAIRQKLDEVNEAMSKFTPYRVALVDPVEIEEVPVNARFMSPYLFKALVENVRKDGNLGSVPLCIKRDGKLRVLSGNHRVRAAREAGIQRILVLVLPGKVTRSRELAIQLSHNALAGQDNPAKMAELYRQVTSLADLKYTAIPEASVAKIEADLSMPTNVSLDLKVVNLALTPHELAQADKIMEALSRSPRPDVTFVFPREEWNAFLDATAAMRKRFNIISRSTAVLKLLEIAKEYLGQDGTQPAASEA